MTLSYYRSWWTLPPHPLLAHFTYPRSVLLSVSLVGLLFHSPSIVLLCLLLLIHHPIGVPCRFKARSDSLCGPRRPSTVMVTCAAHLSNVQHPLMMMSLISALSVLCKGDLLRWILKFPIRCFKDLLLPSVYLEYSEWTWRPLCMHGQLLFVAKVIFFTK